MKNVIILSCSTGQGHNSCAEAIRETLEEKNISCRICDSLDFVSPRVSRFVSWGHSFMYRHIPGLFRWGYRLSEEHPGVFEKSSVIYRILRRGTGRMYDYLTAGKYDTVICTHMFAALSVTELLERHPLQVQTAFVATDYAGYPGTETCGLENFFIPCASLTGEYRNRVGSHQRVVATGIPVRKMFWTRREKEEAKAALHIGAKNRHLLIMCGSMGCGPIVKLLGRVTEKLPADLEVTVICGTNERLREKLTRQYEKNDRVHIVGYTEDVSLYMDSADLYLTKPGGISVTEAAAKDLPMAFINAVAGCENYNMGFFTDMGAAITDSSIDRLAQKCIQLLSSDDELRKMRQALKDYRQPNGAELIYQELCKGVRP